MTKVDDELDMLVGEIVGRFDQLQSHDVATVRNLRRSFSKQIAKQPAHFVTELALRLLQRPAIPRFVAFELIQHHRAAVASLNAGFLEQLASGNNSWDTVDAFACYLSGPAWRERLISDAVIKRWSRSPNRWWRRTALVSTIPLNNKTRGGSGDTRRTLMICEKLVADDDDMVVKALSWALRELSKRDTKPVRKFLQEHKSQLAPRVVREVSSKLETGFKNPRRANAAD